MSPRCGEREAPGLLWSVDSIPVHLSISKPDLIELDIGPEVSFDRWSAANVLDLANFCICLNGGWTCTKQRVIELFGKFLISQVVHSQNLKMPCGDKIWTRILSGVGSEEGRGDQRLPATFTHKGHPPRIGIFT